MESSKSYDYSKLDAKERQNKLNEFIRFCTWPTGGTGDCFIDCVRYSLDDNRKELLNCDRGKIRKLLVDLHEDIGKNSDFVINEVLIGNYSIEDSLEELKDPRGKLPFSSGFGACVASLFLAKPVIILVIGKEEPIENGSVIGAQCEIICEESKKTSKEESKKTSKVVSNLIDFGDMDDKELKDKLIEYAGMGKKSVFIAHTFGHFQPIHTDVITRLKAIRYFFAFKKLGPDLDIVPNRESEGDPHHKDEITSEDGITSEVEKIMQMQNKGWQVISDKGGNFENDKNYDSNYKGRKSCNII